MCMADGNMDRVGFVKQDTADSVFAKYSGKYGSLSDYELLCTDGTRKGQLIILCTHNITFEMLYAEIRLSCLILCICWPGAGCTKGG